MRDVVVFEKDGKIGRVILNRPDAYNALNLDMHKCLREIFKEIEEDKTIRVVVITGAGKAFCAGADIGEIMRLEPMTGDVHLDSLLSSFEAIEKIDVPVIAAINGHALGAGLELAMRCDLRIAKEKAKLGLPEVNIGAIPGAGGTQLLPRLVGKTKAMELIMLGKLISAKEAEALGLINKAVSDSEFDSAVYSLAEELASKSPIALSLIKNGINEGLKMSLASALEFEKQLFTKLLVSEDFKEGVRAFTEKREPKFMEKRPEFKL